MAFEYYETVLGFNIAGNYAAVVQHWGFDKTGSETPFEIAKDIVTVALENAPVSTAYIENMVALMGDECYLSSARARRVSGTGGATYVKPFDPADWAGTFGGDVDSSAVAGFALGFTDGGAGLFAKNWIPGVSENALVAGRFTNAYQLAMVDYLDAWIAGMPGTVYNFDPYLKHGAGPTFTRIVRGQIGATPGTIRRRLVPI